MSCVNLTLSDNADTISCGSSARSCDSSSENTSLTFGFNEKTRKTDLTLVINEERAHVSRAVLELMSPVFQNLLDAHEDTDEIDVESKDYGEFVEFLACFYPGKSHKVTVENVFRMLPLADEYDIDHVKNQCETCLQTILDSTDTSTELFFRCIQVVYKHRLGLKKQCLNALESRPLSDIEKTCDPDTLPVGARSDMYETMVPKLIRDVYKCRYLFAGMSKKRVAKFDEWQDATYFTIDMCMKSDVAGIQTSNMVDMWGLQWCINITRHMSQGVLGTFLVTLKCCLDEESRVSFESCEGIVTIVVKNNIPWNENVTKEVQFSMTPSTLCSPDTRVQESAVFDRNAGFLMDKRYSITGHVLLQKPTFKIMEQCDSDKPEVVGQLEEVNKTDPV